MTFPRLLRPAAVAALLLLAACAGGGDVREPVPAAAVSSGAAAAEPVAASAATANSAGIAQGDGSAAAVVEPGDAMAFANQAPPGDATTNAEADPGAGEPTAPPTQAELDYVAIYGGDPYDPVADPTLPDPAVLPSSYDPWEKWNRRVHRFNNAIDRGIARPLAEAYVAAVPRPVRLGVGNFFNNLGQPVSALNALLQGKPRQAGQSLARFAVNSTIGLVGIFDPASKFGIPNRSEDFGQTLGVWGWGKSRYLELPLFGPRTVRDTFGLVGDGQLSPLQHVEEDKVRVFLQGTQLVDTRTQLMALDSMREGATDEYALVRDGWMQRRQYQIFGDREQHDEALPEYLQDDTAPYIPVDVMPVVPGSPGG